MHTPNKQYPEKDKTRAAGEKPVAASGTSKPMVPPTAPPSQPGRTDAPAKNPDARPDAKPDATPGVSAPEKHS